MSNKPFGVIAFDGTTVRSFSSVKEAAEKLGMSESAVRRALYGTLKDIGDLRIYYNNKEAIEDIAASVKKKQDDILRELGMEDGKKEGVEEPKKSFVKMYAERIAMQRSETPESFARRLTDKNEYLAHDWEKDLHFKCIVKAYEWGMSVI